MKTATIRINHIFGTKNSFCADVSYHGRLIKSFEGNGTSPELVQRAITFAKGYGFTHHKISLG
jgi:hypothetical protein